MFNKVKSIVYFILVICFITYTIIHYFSNEHQNKIVSNRETLSSNDKQKVANLPFLENDTNNIIEYNVITPNEKKSKKRYFWNLLKKND